MVQALEQPDRWGERILRELPLDLERHARSRWIQVANTGPKYPGLRHDNPEGLAPYARANRALGQLRQDTAELRDALSKIALPMDAADADIREVALRAADLCERRNFSGELIAQHLGLELEWPKRVTDEGKLRRFADPKFWRAKLRRFVGRITEETMRKHGLVRFGKAVYVSDWSLRRWQGQRGANRRMMENSVLVNEEGAQLDLWEVAQASLSNPANRRKEMMTRAKGFELQALQNGYTWTFATLTAPSAFHPQLEAGGDNPRYEGGSVRAAQAWLCKRWEKARAQLDRDGIRFFGFRVAEPNHDGTPHWHALLFVTDAQVDRLEEVLREEWLSEYGSERGALEHRTKFKRYDSAVKGASAAGYIAKYIGKNIDGCGVEMDHTARMDGASASVRATAWASIHGIRQFQQLGGPAVGLWRELRRLREPVVPEEIEAARVHTSKPACWSKFIDAVGGIAAGRKTTLQLWKQQTLDLNRYGEQRAPSVIGVASLMHWIRTRWHEWRIQRKAAGQGTGTDSKPRPAGRVPSHSAPLPSLGPVSITVRGSKTMPGEGSTGAPRSGSPRGSPWMH